MVPLKGAVNGVSPQQTGPFHQVAFRARAHYHGPQPPLIAPAAARDQDPRQYASDPAKAVEHHVLRFVQQLLPAIDFSQLLAHKSVHIPVRVTFVEPGSQLADIYPRRGQVQPGQSLEDRKARKHAEFVLDHLASKAMGLEDVDRGVVHQGAAVDRGDHAVIPVEFADERDHGLGDLFPLGPIGKVAFHLLVDHLLNSLSAESIRCLASRPTPRVRTPIDKLL